MGVKMAPINFVSVFFIIILSIGLANALVDPKPVLYGQAFDGAVAADGSIVTIYPQNNVSDKLSDTVGAAGNVGVSSYWKLELNDLDTNVQNGDIIVINLSDGVSYTTRSYTVDLDGDGAVYILLNLDPAFQDYDDDGFFADTDCDDNDAQINPDADEIEDGVDNDCDATIDEGGVCSTIEPEPEATSTEPIAESEPKPEPVITTSTEPLVETSTTTAITATSTEQ